MNYFQIRFTVPDEQTKEILFALLSDAGFESFQEEESDVLAYIQKDQLDEEKLTDILNNYGINDFQKDEIIEKNWNKLWEQNFQPVVIRNELLIRAPFHQPEKDYPQEIIIEPQMSFGTAHHDTTALMLELMLDVDFNGKRVLDMGSGTGILAILAAKKSAARVVAIDNNMWASTNSTHNMELNELQGIEVIEGEKESIPDEKFDIILANINRNVLLEDISAYTKHLLSPGLLLLSGFLSADLQAILGKCEDHGLQFKENLQKNDWIAAAFIK